MQLTNGVINLQTELYNIEQKCQTECSVVSGKDFISSSNHPILSFERPSELYSLHKEYLSFRCQSGSDKNIPTLALHPDLSDIQSARSPLRPDSP